MAAGKRLHSQLIDDERQECKPDKHTDKHIAGRENSAYERKKQNRNRNDNKQEACAAARMQAGHAAAVFNCQRKLRFIAADGLMLCTVIGKTRFMSFIREIRII